MAIPSRLPTEVELVYEVMPCNALRTAQEPKGEMHPCTYFRKWGTYHSYDYASAGIPAGRGVIQEAVYVGRAPLVPELLSGCRKAPILALGINPNLPGWWSNHRRSLNPLFDDYHQYAHYFRYRAVDKVEISAADYAAYGGGPADDPFSDFELNVPADAQGRKSIKMQRQPQRMYQVYQGILDGLAQAMSWPANKLSVGEDLSYANMVASPSARWTTAPVDEDPTLPPMTTAERDGIVSECFDKRKYFPRQLFQSLPAVLLVFSQATANAFIGAFNNRFIIGKPKVGETLTRLGSREVRFQYGSLNDGTTLSARVIFAPHATGNPAAFAKARRRVIENLIEEAKAGALSYNPRTGRLSRPPGACVYCPMLEIGDCDYVNELRPLTNQPRLTADSPVQSLLAEKETQTSLMNRTPAQSVSNAGWDQTDDIAESEALRER